MLEKKLKIIVMYIDLAKSFGLLFLKQLMLSLFEVVTP